MSLRLEMLQVARLAPKLLGDSAALVAAFLRAQQNEDGGFKDRDGKSDLYYTVFGIDSLLALQADMDAEAVQSFLHKFDAGTSLDFVHLCCLARCWAGLSALGNGTIPSTQREAILTRLAAFRAKDGGFNPIPDSAHGTAYGAFLALGAWQDLRTELPDPLRLVQSLKFLETADGAWTNELGIRNSTLETPPSGGGASHAIGSTNASAAAITVLRNLSMPVNAAAGDWLLARAHPQGGFLAMPNAPIPDLLSTATALHALAGMQVPFDHLKDPCLDFIDSLWTNEGSFHGNWADEHLDCEYTFYGLLALGHLSL